VVVFLTPLLTARMPPPWPSGLSINLTYVGYLVAFGGAALACLALVPRSQRVDRRDVRIGLLALMITSGGWAALHVGMLIAPTLSWKTGFYEAGLTVGFGTVWAWLYFCSAYSGRSLHHSRSAQWGSLLLFGTVTVTKLTNAWHGLYFSGTLTASPFPHLEITHYPLYWGTAGLSYALAAVGFFMLFDSLRRVQLGAGLLMGLFGLTALPLAANVAGYISPVLLDLNHEPVGVAVFAAGVLYVSTRRFEGAGRAGRHDKPALVLSDEGRLRNCNEAAVTLFPHLDSANVFGRPLSTLLPSVTTALSADAENGRASPPTDVISIEDAGPTETSAPRYYQVTLSPFGARGDGQLVILTDVTEQTLRRRSTAREREARLRRQKHLLEQTQQLAGAWEADLSRRTLSLSSETRRIFKLDDPEISFDDALCQFAPAVRDEVRSAFLTCVRTGTPYDLEVPLETPAGAPQWVRVVGGPAPSPNDAPHTVAGAVTDVTEQTLYEEKLQEAKEEAEKVARLKSTMLANMTHEVRTPLTSIISFAGVLKGRLSGQDKKYARLVHRGGERLLDTLNSILELSKLEADPEELSRDVFALQDLVRGTSGLLEQSAAEKGVALTLDTNGTPVWIRANETAVDRILENLLSNAIKFTPEDGEVHLQVSAHGDWGLLTIEDTGVGIAADAQSDIFDAFQQESKGLDREYDGSGLGLTITKRLVETLGGSIDVESRKGEGSCFTVRLPLADQN
jgi:signal transduction histidine kinase